jgi:hypothetical protein
MTTLAEVRAEVEHEFQMSGLNAGVYADYADAVAKRYNAALLAEVDRLKALGLPDHKCGLYLEHNAHRDVYENIEQWIADQVDEDDWVSPEERAKAIAEDSVWTLQWYPDTPIGFFRRAASSLDALLAELREATNNQERIR